MRASRHSIHPRGRIPLRALQAWFQGEILRAEVLPRAKRSAGAPAAETLVLPSRSLAPAERVAIYARSYFARLHDCLAEDFPTVRRLLGDAGFLRLARLYLGKFPSRHYSLNHLGTDLPRFLEGPLRVPRRALLRDVARVETSMGRVFDAEHTPPLAPEELASLTPERLGMARLRPIAAFELLALDHPVNALITAARQERTLPRAVRRPAWTAVFRRNFQVVRIDLTEAQHALLEALASGKTVLAALHAAARRWPGNPEGLGRKIFRWFEDWAQEGIFRSLDLASTRKKRR